MFIGFLATPQVAMKTELENYLMLTSTLYEDDWYVLVYTIY